MKKRIFCISFVCLLVLGMVIAILFLKIAGKGIRIRIYNETDEEVINLCIAYTGSKEDILVPIVEMGETKDIFFELPDDFNEGNVTLYYYDKKRIRQEEVIIGYIEKNRNYHVEVFIESMDSDGILKVNAK